MSSKTTATMGNKTFIKQNTLQRTHENICIIKIGIKNYNYCHAAVIGYSCIFLKDNGERYFAQNKKTSLWFYMRHDTIDSFNI